MIIKIKTLAAGPMGVIQPGSSIEVTEEAGRAWVASGFAEDITPRDWVPGKPIEVEMIEAPEKRTVEKPSEKGGRNKTK